MSSTGTRFQTQLILSRARDAPHTIDTLLRKQIQQVACFTRRFLLIIPSLPLCATPKSSFPKGENLWLHWGAGRGHLCHFSSTVTCVVQPFTFLSCQRFRQAEHRALQKSRGSFIYVSVKNLKQDEAQTAHAESTHKLHQRYILKTICHISEDVPLVEFMYFVFTRMPGESYRRRLRSLLYLCDVFRALINSLSCWF